MALPADGQNANGLTKVTQIPAGKELMFIDPTTNEGGIITLEDLTKQILNGLTSQTFGLDSGTQTLPAAINYLYGNNAIYSAVIQTTQLLKKIIINAGYGTLMQLFFGSDSVGSATIYAGSFMSINKNCKDSILFEYNKETYDITISLAGLDSCRCMLLSISPIKTFKATN